jgi:hypothetical protein
MIKIKGAAYVPYVPAFYKITRGNFNMNNWSRHEYVAVLHMLNNEDTVENMK